MHLYVPCTQSLQCLMKLITCLSHEIMNTLSKLNKYGNYQQVNIYIFVYLTACKKTSWQKCRKFPQLVHHQGK